MKKRSEAKKARARVHTAQNKIKRIEKALKYAGGTALPPAYLSAGGSAVEFLQGRLNYWKGKV